MDAEKRRVDLEKWLGALVWRCDVLSSEYFYNFCNVIKVYNISLQNYWIVNGYNNQSHLLFFKKDMHFL
jgi:hypothetical protein